MRVINSIGEDIDSYDLKNGYLLDTKVIKVDAKPIDNVTKFAYDDSDYEDAKMFIPVPIEEQIESIKAKLRETDYIALKIVEGAATKEEYADLIEQRQKWRDQINELRNSINEN